MVRTAVGALSRRTRQILRLAELVHLPASFSAGILGVQIGAGTRLRRGAVLDTSGGGRITIGRNCDIHAGARVLTIGGDIRLGDDCSLNPYTIVYGPCEIGSGVRIAAHCVIIPQNHNFDRLDVPIAEQGVTTDPITIEDDVWMGAGVKVLAGVRIARGCVIAAGAVVTRSTEPQGVYAGVPARLIRARGTKGG